MEDFPLNSSIVVGFSPGLGPRVGLRVLGFVAPAPSQRGGFVAETRRR